jgi:RNase P protein component
VRALSLKKGERLLKRADFERLSKDGNRIDSDYFVILYRRNGLGKLRVGVTRGYGKQEGWARGNT